MSGFDSAGAAEAAFYRSFETLNLDAMRAVWSADDDVICVHPMGPSMRGAPAVLESWQELFAGGDRLRFTTHMLSSFEDTNYAVHHLYEQIVFGSGHQRSSVIIATNAYRRSADGWQMVLHHGSPGRADPQPQQPIPGSTMH